MMHGQKKFRCFLGTKLLIICVIVVVFVLIIVNNYNTIVTDALDIFPREVDSNRANGKEAEGNKHPIDNNNMKRNNDNNSVDVKNPFQRKRRKRNIAQYFKDPMIIIKKTGYGNEATNFMFTNLQDEYLRCKRQLGDHRKCKDLFIKMQQIAGDILGKINEMKSISEDNNQQDVTGIFKNDPNENLIWPLTEKLLKKANPLHNHEVVVKANISEKNHLGSHDLKQLLPLNANDTSKKYITITPAYPMAAKQSGDYDGDAYVRTKMDPIGTTCTHPSMPCYHNKIKPQIFTNVPKQSVINVPLKEKTVEEAKLHLSPINSTYKKDMKAKGALTLNYSNPSGDIVSFQNLTVIPEDHHVSFITEAPFTQLRPLKPKTFSDNLPLNRRMMRPSPRYLIKPYMGVPNVPTLCFYVWPFNVQHNFMLSPSSLYSPSATGDGIGFPNGPHFIPQSYADKTVQNPFGTAPGILGSLPQIFPKQFQYPLSPFPYQQKQQQQQVFCGHLYDDSTFPTSGYNNVASTGGASIMNFRTPIPETNKKNLKVNSNENFETDAECKSPNQMTCLATNKCIDKSYWCDGETDCSDSSDEMYCNCRQKISNDRICDGYADCPLNEDEMGCYGCGDLMFSCFHDEFEYERYNKTTVHMCYSSLQICDGFSNCLNGKDELDCNRIFYDPFSPTFQSRVSTSNGYLYHNYRGEWYPVCYGDNMWWVQEACEAEGGHTGNPIITSRTIWLPGPFIQIFNNRSHFVQRCANHNNGYNALLNSVTSVQCNPPMCGIVKELGQENTKYSRKVQVYKRAINAGKIKRVISEGEERIVGGSLSKPMEWPFIVAIYRNGQFHCGGSIYADQWIITAAHCVIHFPKYYYEIRAGMLRRSSFSAAVQSRTVSHIIIHEAYEHYTLRNDFALLRLLTPLQFNRWIKPICLPDVGRTTNGSNWIWGPEEGTSCIAIGWGALCSIGDHLRHVTVPVRKMCKSDDDRKSENICAGDVEGGRDACQGDSGGPLLCPSITNPNEWYLAGVVSHGYGCARPNEFGVYTRVALYLDWIEASMRYEFFPKMQPLQSCPGFRCMHGIKYCLHQSKRCDHFVDCLAGEDEFACIYSANPLLPSIRNLHTNITDYYPEGDALTSLSHHETTTDIDMKEKLTTSTESTTINEIINVLQSILKSKEHEVDNNGKYNSIAETANENSETYSSTETSTTQFANMSTDVETTTVLPPSSVMTQLAEKFICKLLHQIIDSKHRCDHVLDCEDGTDESNCTCRDFMKGKLAVLICDGKTDCLDMTDESDCEICNTEEYMCPLTKSCVPLEKRCDGRKDCTYDEDEKDCFALTNGKEIILDRFQQPKLNNAGILTRNVGGVWRIVCVNDSTSKQQGQKMAQDVCTLFGFISVKFHNLTNLRFTENLKNFTHSEFKRLRIAESIATVPCMSLFVECVPKYNKIEPIKTISADLREDITNPLNTERHVEPFVITLQKPFVHVKSHQNNVPLAPAKRLHVAVGNKLYETIEEIHWPWLVDVYANGKLWCLGILLDRHWVLVHESCYFGIRLSLDYMAVLLGGGKTQHAIHKSNHEEIRRVDCLKVVPNSDALLLHLEQSVEYSHFIMAMYLPEFSSATVHNKCFALLHENINCRTRAISVMMETNSKLCSKDGISCYRLMERTPIELLAISVSNNNSSKVVNCTDFGQRKAGTNAASSGGVLQPIDQGILVCRQNNTSWYPAAFFTYNNTNCHSFKEAFPIRSLIHEFHTIHHIIEQSNCSFSYTEPNCLHLRCPLGLCLNDNRICDGHFDCHDGLDEQPDVCRRRKRGCNPWEMKCQSSGKCLPKTKFCDHIADCQDLTDEPTICSCLTYLKATDPTKICDGIRNCWDKSDESPALCNCTDDRYHCDQYAKDCIPQEFVCDKTPDCPNGEDERFCYGLEQPHYAETNIAIGKNNVTFQKITPSRSLVGYSQVVEQSFGIWHTKCFPKSMPPDIYQVRQLCTKLGFNPYFSYPSYRFVNDTLDNDGINQATTDDKNSLNVKGNMKRKRSYGMPTKVVVTSKFSSLILNNDLILFLKSSRPMAELVPWNATDGEKCIRLEIKCS